MLLKSLPDFQYCLTAAGNRVFAAHEKAGEYILMPDSLALARPDGKNRACRLTLVRGRSPKLAPDPHGLLECMPGLHYPWEEALQSIRKLRPGAVLRPAGFSRCSIFLELPDGKRVSGELNGIHFLFHESSFELKLSEEAACMAKSLQENGLNGVSGVAEVVLEGVSPRLPVKVRFDSRKLLAGIENFSGKGQGIGRPEILKFFSQPPEYLPLEISGKLKEGTLELNPWLFAETLADRFIYRFGTQLSSGIKGSFEWDLSVPCRVFRSYVLPLRTFEAPGKATSCRELVVPAFRTEPMQVKVSADLPFRIYGLFALGVTLRVPPYREKAAGFRNPWN
ncbi:hypothetical protein ACSAZK_00595 [Methanosarcina sp. Mfa9]|uniref:hypothetical protein n=1 Tax=Methanosarcina sp. Mfa9 TaxID=3439063 RepID=UPI003F8396AA